MGTEKGVGLVPRIGQGWWEGGCPRRRRPQEAELTRWTVTVPTPTPAYLPILHSRVHCHWHTAASFLQQEVLPVNQALNTTMWPEPSEIQRPLKT